MFYLNYFMVYIHQQSGWCQDRAKTHTFTSNITEFIAKFVDTKIGLKPKHSHPISPNPLKQGMITKSLDSKNSYIMKIASEFYQMLSTISKISSFINLIYFSVKRCWDDNLVPVGVRNPNWQVWRWSSNLFKSSSQGN